MIQLADEWWKQSYYIITYIIMKKHAFQEKTRKWVIVRDHKTDVCVWRKARGKVREIKQKGRKYI